MSGENLAFLPHLQESVMDELRTTEGMIFRDEGVKKLFLDLKTFVMEPLQVAFSSSVEIFQGTLDMYLKWDENIKKEELQRMELGFTDAIDRLTSVCVLYAKYIYARSTPDTSVSIKKPRMENMLRGMFTRLARLPSIRNGSFFTLDPMKQDFVLRDIFRLSLGNDCINVIPTESDVLVKEEVDWSAGLAPSDDIGPDDSISRVMTRLEEKEELEQFERSKKPLETLEESPAVESEELIAQEENKEPEKSKETEREKSIVQSAFSNVSSTSKQSIFKKPKVRKVIIEENEEE